MSAVYSKLIITRVFILRVYWVFRFLFLNRINKLLIRNRQMRVFASVGDEKLSPDVFENIVCAWKSNGSERGGLFYV